MEATLCTTDQKEPWAANVHFKVEESSFITTLNKGYTHYKNIIKNKNVVVCYKNSSMEIIARGKADIRDELENNTVSIEIKVGWIRTISGLTVQDSTSKSRIIDEFKRLG